MPGRFIVLEGPDGAGTTSHGQLLSAALLSDGHDVLLTAEPTGGSIGTYVRHRLSSGDMPSPAAMQLLFCADRAQHVEEVIKPALAAGKIIVCDRYVPSTMVYGQAAGVDEAWLSCINAVFPKPDILLYLLPPFAVCRQRIALRTRQDAFEKETFQRRVHELYQSIAKDHAHVLDSSGTKEETADIIAKIVAADM